MSSRIALLARSLRSFRDGSRTRRLIFWTGAGLVAVALVAGVAVGVARWLPRAPAVHEVTRVRTNTIDLQVTRFDVGVMSRTGSPGRGAIRALDPQRLLLAAHTGRFFLFTVGERSVAVAEIPIRIDNNREQLATYAAGHLSVAVDVQSLRINDLMIYNQGRDLAASVTYWDVDNNCTVLKVISRPVPSDWSSPEGQWRDLFTSQPCFPLSPYSPRPLSGYQAGGRLAEPAAGKIVISVGDFAHDGMDRRPVFSPDPSVDYGKVIEIDVQTGTSRHLSRGHRNPQGLLVDRRGRIWLTEHGPRGGDELNLIVQGADYGWPAVTEGTEYSLRTWPRPDRKGPHGGYHPPAFAWVPSIAPSNLIELKNLDGEWNGDLLIAGLASQGIFRVRLADDRVIYVEAIPLGHRIRDLTQDETGAVWLWTDDENLLRLRRHPRPVPQLNWLPKGTRSVMAGCLECHSLDPDPARPQAIPLIGSRGRRVAAIPGATYSPALVAQGGSWHDARLERFLADPQREVPGTLKSGAGISDAAVRKEILDFLRPIWH